MDSIWKTDFVIAHTACLARSLKRWTGREERARLLETVARRGFIDDYSGVRISKTGRRFRIIRATVWNLLAEDSRPCG